jgi:hypothetical protein
MTAVEKDGKRIFLSPSSETIEMILDRQPKLLCDSIYRLRFHFLGQTTTATTTTTIIIIIAVPSGKCRLRMMRRKTDKN